MTTLRERRLGRMPSAQDIVTSMGNNNGSGAVAGLGSVGGGGALKSPLAQVKSFASSMPTTTSSTGSSTLYAPQTSSELDQDQPIQQHTAPIPAPDFNLFRSASIYSVASDASDYTVSSSETDTFSASSDESPHPSFAALGLGDVAKGIISGSGPETPTTPRGVKPGNGYFDGWAPAAGASIGAEASRTIMEDLASGQVTPKRSFVVRSRPGVPSTPDTVPASPTAIAVSNGFAYGHEGTASAGPGPSTLQARSLAETHAAAIGRQLSHETDAHQGEIHALQPTRQSMSGADWESIHGEQGSQWGDDEEGYEWLDTDRQPSAENGPLPLGSESRLRLSPSKRLAQLRSHVPGLGDKEDREGSSRHADTKETREPRKLRKPLVLPRRAAPPPPPGPGSPRVPPDTSGSVFLANMNRMPSASTLQSNATRSTRSSTSSSSSSAGSRQALQPRWPNTNTPPSRVDQDMFHPPQAPAMVPLGGEDGSGKTKSFSGRNSGLSVQTGHYSLYELDSGTPTPTAQSHNITGPGSAGSDQTVYAKGTYTSVPASVLRNGNGRSLDQTRSSNGNGNGGPARSPSLNSGHSSKESLLEKGLEARGKGDLPKAAWYFRQSADAGSSTGRMYWGLALRHGWGVAKDDRRAFIELKKACDDSLAEGGGVENGHGHGHGGTGAGNGVMSNKSSTAQKKVMQQDLSLGIFEMANCFLDGVGVKKSPDAAVSYLRYAADLGDVGAQEQLGFLLSKGSNGIKKDMKEAARWYRMAINQGSTNTFGLAWVWKDKYN